jgi:protease-4
LEVDSYGGVPTAGEEVANALKNAKKPTVALIRDSGASAAYMAATGADTIFASKFSNVGGIGVTMSYLDSIEKNKKDGYVFNQLSVGKYKDMGNENKPLTQDEKNLFMRDLNINFDNFIKLVAENRKLDISFVRKLSDGSSMPGELALKNKLIDKIGGIREVEEHLKLLIGEEVEFCAYD